jgi:hypothetical protein
VPPVTPEFLLIKAYNYSLFMANVTGELGLHLVRKMTLAV